MGIIKHFAILFALLGLSNSIMAKSNTMPKNSIGLNTIQISNNHIGLGAYYERVIDNDNRLSLILPLAIGWEMKSSFNRNPALEEKANMSFFVNPGIKFYPTRNKKFFSYAIGLSIFSHFGDAETIYGNNGANPYGNIIGDFSFSTAGILLNNYLNFKINRNISFGFELGVGPTYFNNYKLKGSQTVVRGGITAFPNVAFQIAYRF